MPLTSSIWIACFELQVYLMLHLLSVFHGHILLRAQTKCAKASSWAVVAERKSDPTADAHCSSGKRRQPGKLGLRPVGSCKGFDQSLKTSSNPICRNTVNPTCYGRKILTRSYSAPPGNFATADAPSSGFTSDREIQHKLRVIGICSCWTIKLNPKSLSRRAFQQHCLR